MKNAIYIVVIVTILLLDARRSHGIVCIDDHCYAPAPGRSGTHPTAHE